jgi:hypothetical protein
MLEPAFPVAPVEAVPDRRVTRLLDRADRAVRGDWTPSTSAPVLLTLQLVLLWQVGLRGLDYVRAGTAPALDAGVASPLLGWSLYGAAILVLLGLAARRAVPVILGEALVGAWYLGLGWATLGQHPGPGGLTAAASSIAGVWLLLRPAGGLLPRLAGVAAMLGGQALLVGALGVDYRTSTGLLASGLVHGAIAVGTFILWQRERLLPLLDALDDAEDAPCPTS